MNKTLYYNRIYFFISSWLGCFFCLFAVAWLINSGRAFYHYIARLLNDDDATVLEDRYFGGVLGHRLARYAVPVRQRNPADASSGSYFSPRNFADREASSLATTLRPSERVRNRGHLAHLNNAGYPGAYYHSLS